MSKKQIKNDHLRLRLTADEKTRIEKLAAKEGLPVSQYLRRVLKLAGVLALVLVANCGGTYDTQCSGSGGIDCSVVGQPTCTSSFGDVAPHAFCTRECETDDDCGSDGVCVEWNFSRGWHRVCVAPYWLTLPHR